MEKTNEDKKRADIGVATLSKQYESFWSLATPDSLGINTPYP